jgi:hypothetical protein
MTSLGDANTNRQSLLARAGGHDPLTNVQAPA